MTKDSFFSNILKNGGVVMKMSPEDRAEVVWRIVTQLIQFHSEKNPKAEKINPRHKLKKFFPVKKKRQFYDLLDEHINRWGSVMWDTMENLNLVFNLEPEFRYDFNFQEEWELFETVGDFWMYIVIKLEKEYDEV